MSGNGSANSSMDAMALEGGEGMDVGEGQMTNVPTVGGMKRITKTSMKRNMKRVMKKKLENITATMALLIHMHGIVLPMRLFMPTISQQALLRPILLMPVLITEITRSSSMKSGR